jgi:hypothetical protein
VPAERPIGPIVLPADVASAAGGDTRRDAITEGASSDDAMRSDATEHVAAPSGRDEDEGARAPDLELVTFAELGAPVADDAAPVVTVLEQSVGETIDVGLPLDVREGGKPVLRVVADNTSTHAGAVHARPPSVHAPGLTLLTDLPRGSEPTSDAGEGDIVVGDVRLASSLWRILCDEADQHVTLLQHEVSVLQFDPEHWPIATMVRASHTLCGIHRTGGIALIATTARALEQALLALEERGAPFPGIAQPVLARAIAGLAHFVSRVKAREAFTPADEREAAEIATELDELRHDAVASTPPAEPLIPADEASDRLELVADEPEAEETSPSPLDADAAVPAGADAAALAEADAAALADTGADDDAANAPAIEADASASAPAPHGDAFAVAPTTAGAQAGPAVATTPEAAPEVVVSPSIETIDEADVSAASLLTVEPDASGLTSELRDGALPVIANDARGMATASDRPSPNEGEATETSAGSGN